MFDDLASMFYNNVVAAYGAYVTSRDSDLSGRSSHTRTAIDAATALFHFREHLPEAHAKTRAEVAAECPDYRLVADVVNAAKHHVLTRTTSEGLPLVTSAKDIEEIIVCTEYEDDEGTYTDARTVVIVNCSDNVRRSLDNALTAVLNYWGGELKRLGIVGYAPRAVPEAPGARFVSRSEARAANLELLKGLGSKLNFQIMKFDVTKGHSEPVDLSDSEVTWRVFKPAYSVDVTAMPPGGDSPVTCSIDLTEEQSDVFHELATDAEREAFLRPLLVERQEEVGQKLGEVLRTQEAAEACADTGDDE